MTWPFATRATVDALAEKLLQRDTRIANLEAALARAKLDARDNGPWADLCEPPSKAPEWLRIVATPLWVRSVEPWLKRLYLDTIDALTNSAEGARSQELKVRAALLRDLLATPHRAMAHQDAALDNAWGAGEPIPGDNEREETRA